MDMKKIRVNDSPAQTWNYLHINDVAFEVPVLQKKGATCSCCAGLMALGAGIGDEASAYIENAAHACANIDITETPDKPLIIDITADMTSTLITIAEDVEATVVIRSFAQEASADELQGQLFRIRLHERAHLHLFEVIDAPYTPSYIDGIGLEMHESAFADVEQYVLGCAGRMAQGLEAQLIGKKATLNSKLRYVVPSDALLDVNQVARLSAPTTAATFNDYGILHDRSAKTLRCTIDLVRGAAGASGLEHETVLLAGEHISNKTLPSILCNEEDVAGNHGATLGAISPEQLLYFENRGLTTEEALALLTRCIYDDAALAAPDADTRNLICDAAYKALGDDETHDMVSYAIELEGEIHDER